MGAKIIMGRRRIKASARKYPPEKMTIVEGVLFKASGDFVKSKSAAPNDERYRRAYHKMHLRLFADRGIWPEDGEYLLVDGVMQPAPVTVQ